MRDIAMLRQLGRLLALVIRITAWESAQQIRFPLAQPAPFFFATETNHNAVFRPHGNVLR
jgi:hypothetical protein